MIIVANKKATNRIAMVAAGLRLRRSVTCQHHLMSE
jgi:hypothetical protein